MSWQPLFGAGRHGKGAINAGFARLFAPRRCGVCAYSADIGEPMDLKLKPFDFNQAVARAGLRPDGMPLARATAAAAPVAGGFQTALTQALSNVSAQQMDAERLQREVSLDNPTVSLEQTMMATQKAQLGFAATLQVRNRLVQAYSDIMNMNV